MIQNDVIQVLSIEDNPADAILIQEMLEQAHTLGWDVPSFDVMWVSRLSKGIAQLERSDFDVILTDLDLPDSRAGETFMRLHDRAPLMPIVVLTGRESEELARETVRAGAEDYLFKREMSGPLLAHALIYAIERRRDKAELQRAHDELEGRVAQRTATLRESEARLRAVLACASDAMALSDPEGIILEANQAYLDLYDYTAEEIIGQSFAVIFPEAMRAGAVAQYKDIFAAPEIPPAFESVVQRGDGTTRVVESRIGFITPDGAHGTTGTARTAMLSVIRDITERTRAEEELRESQRFVQHIAETLPGMLYVFDLDEARNVFVNQELTAILGYSKDEIAALGDQVMRTLMHSEDFKPIAEVRRRFEAVPDEQILEWEYRMRHKDGGWRWLHSWETVFERDDGAVRRILGVAQDVTSFRAMASALHESRERYRRLVETSPDAITLADPDGTIVMCNDQAVHLHGYENEKGLLGKNALDLVMPEERERVQENMRKVLEGQDPVRASYRMVRGDGGYFFAEIYASLIVGVDGAPEAILGITRDITERVEAEAALRDSQALLTATQTMTRTGGWEIDGETLALTWTEETYCIHEVELDYIPTIEKGVAFYTSEAQPVIREAVTRALQQGEPFDLELPFVTAKGRRRWVRALGYPTEKDGTITRVTGAFQDITPRRETQDTLLRQTRELRMFASTLSHDLQEPLRTVSGFLRLLSARCDESLDEKAHEYLHLAINGAERMRTMIDALLHYSQIDTQPQPANPVDSDAVLAEAIEDLRFAIAEHGAIITHDPLPHVLSDPAQLRQVFQNLLLNALKFHAEDRTPKVHITARPEGDMWIFSVRDNGIGLDTDDPQEVFQLFRRLHTEEEYEGAGVGLAICKKVVEHDGGAIWVESEIGVGSTFHFSLPSAT